MAIPNVHFRGALSGVVLLALLLPACDKPSREKGTDPTPIVYPSGCVSYEFDVRPLPYDSLPYTNYRPPDTTELPEPHDSAGVVYFEWNGGRHYHPVGMCQKALTYVDLFRQTGDSTYLSNALAYIERLILEADRFDSCLYFPYTFDYKVHQRDDALLKAPWYSGMAQGQALSLLVRTFQITGDSAYLQQAHGTYLALTRNRGTAEPWVVFEDSLGCYWIEEYPTSPQPSMTLNGFVFGIYGLYDYYLQTRSEDVKSLLSRSLSTVKNYIPSYRRSHEVSFYGLTFHHYAADYHRIHIKQLRQLTSITGDSFFVDWADTLASDYRE